MDRYDRVIRDVQQKTDEDLLRWEVVRPESHSKILMNADHVLRAYRADYGVGGKSYVLLFVERKVDRDDEFGFGYPIGGSSFELFIVEEDGEIVLRLFDGAVDRDDLTKLAGLIEEHNDRVKGFFAAFDEPGVA